MPRLLLGVLLLFAAGCGGDDTVSVESPTPEATAVLTETPAPSPTATETPAPTPTEQPPPSPEEQEGGAGDEDEARVPARFVVSADGIDPPRLSVPAFLAIELIVVNRPRRRSSPGCRGRSRCRWPRARRAACGSTAAGPAATRSASVPRARAFW